MNTGFKVIKAGLQATIQDLGRRGLADIGVSSSGAMDEFAFHMANKLLGNEYGTNMLEIVFGGVELEAVGSTVFVLTGAQVVATLNGKTIELWKTYKIDRGEILKIGFATSGVRVYLAVKGGFDVEEEYGSCSVSIKEKIGGAPISVDQLLPFSSSEFKYSLKYSSQYQPKYGKSLELRVVAGYQWDMFEAKERDTFFNSKYDVTAQNDRMGYRLSGQKIVSKSKGIISEPIAYGAIQIPAQGEPIVLLKERQTIGGYPKIGSVIPVDCFRLAQAKQGTEISFKLISIDEAREISKEFYELFLFL